MQFIVSIPFQLFAIFILKLEAVFYRMFLHEFRAMVVEVAVVVPCGRPASSLPEVGKSKLKGETATLMGEVELEEESQSITSLVVSIATTQTPVVDRRDPEETLNQEVLG